MQVCESQLDFFLLKLQVQVRDHDSKQKYHKIPKNSDSQKISVIILKFENFGFDIKVSKNAEMSCDMIKPTKLLCAQQRLRSDWADQSLHCPHEESLGPELPTERKVKALIRLGGCQG